MILLLIIQDFVKTIEQLNYFLHLDYLQMFARSLLLR